VTKLIQAVHNEGGNIGLQLVHGGRKTTKSAAGEVSIGSSYFYSDPLNLVTPREMRRKRYSRSDKGSWSGGKKPAKVINTKDRLEKRSQAV
jgi:hypothetical protein